MTDLPDLHDPVDSPDQGPPRGGLQVPAPPPLAGQGALFRGADTFPALVRRLAKRADDNPLQDPALRSWADQQVTQALRPAKPGRNVVWTAWPAAKPGQVHVAYGGRTKQGDWASFCRHVEDEHLHGDVRAKRLGPHFSMVVNRYAVPGKDGRRCNEDTLLMTALSLDADLVGHWDDLLAWLRLHGVAFCAYQTTSWTPHKNKWRTIIPLYSGFDVRCDEHRDRWRKAFGAARVLFGAVGGLKGNGFDPAFKAPSQAVYYGTRQAHDQPIRQTIWQDGLRLDLDALVALLPKEPERETPQLGTGRLVQFSMSPALNPSSIPLPVRIQRAQQWLADNPPPARGTGLNAAIGQAVRALWIGCGLSDSDAWPLLDAWTPTGTRKDEATGWVQWIRTKSGGSFHGALLRDVPMPKTPLTLWDGEKLDLPDLFDVPTEASTSPADDLGLDAILETIRPRSLAEAELQLPEMLKTALTDAAMPGAGGKPKLIVLDVPLGVGKTRRGLDAVVREAGWVWTGPSHALLAEAQDVLRGQGVPWREARGLLAFTGPDACDRPTLVKWAADLGHNPRHEICAKCPRRQGCVARAGEKGSGELITAPHALAPKLADDDRIGKGVIYDEQPALLDLWTSSVDDLTRPILSSRTAGDASLLAWAAARRPAADAIQKVAEAAKAQWEKSIEEHGEHPIRWWGERLEALVRLAIGKDPQPIIPVGEGVPFPPGEALHALHEGGRRLPADAPHVRTDEALRGVLNALDGWCLRAEPEGVVIERRGIPRRAPLPSVILDATASEYMDAIIAAWPGHEVEFRRILVAAQDGATQARYRQSRRVSRSRYALAPAEFWKQLVVGVQDAVKKHIRRFGGTGLKVGVISHKPAADFLRNAWDRKFVPDGPLGSAVAALDALKADGTVSEYRALHYGNCRGSNALKDVQVLVSVGDPTPNLGAIEADAAFLFKVTKAEAIGGMAATLAFGLTVAEVTQAQGRARAVRRTTQDPVTLVHVGRAVPGGPGWAWDARSTAKRAEATASGAGLGPAVEAVAEAKGLSRKEAVEIMLAELGFAGRGAAKVLIDRFPDLTRMVATTVINDVSYYQVGDHPGPTRKTVDWDRLLAALVSVASNDKIEATVRSLGVRCSALNLSVSGRRSPVWVLWEKRMAAADLLDALRGWATDAMTADLEARAAAQKAAEESAVPQPAVPTREIMTLDGPLVVPPPEDAPWGIVGGGRAMPETDSLLDARMEALSDVLLDDKAPTLGWPVLMAKRNGAEGGLPPPRRSRSSTGGG